MDDVEADEQRDPEARFLNRETLHFARGVGPDKIEQVADPAGADVVGGMTGDHRSGHGVAGGHHGELTELLGEAHPLYERLDAPCVLRFECPHEVSRIAGGSGRPVTMTSTMIDRAHDSSDGHPPETEAAHAGLVPQLGTIVRALLGSPVAKSLIALIAATFAVI